MLNAIEPFYNQHICCAVPKGDTFEALFPSRQHLVHVNGWPDPQSGRNQGPRNEHMGCLCLL